MATLRTFVAEQRCRSVIVPGQECTRRDAFCESLANDYQNIIQPPCSAPANPPRYRSFATEDQQTNQGRHHDPHRFQVCNRDRRVHAPGLQRAPRGFLRAIERQETRALPAIRDDVRHGPDQPAGPDLRSGPKSLCRGGRHWRHVDADGRRGLPDRHQYLQPLHGRLQRPRDPRAAQWQEGDGRRQPAQHDRQLRRQLRPDRCRLHRSTRSTC